VELQESPGEIQEAKVIVTFLARGSVNLKERGISEAEAAELRWRLGSIAEDWDRPEMDVYDDLSPRSTP